MSSQTSGFINSVTVTRDQIIADALSDLRLLGANGTPSADDFVTCTLKLNFLLKKWGIKGLWLWCRDTLVIPCQANKASYTIGPAGADVISYRPLRALEGTFIRFTTAGQNFDVQLTLLSRMEYQQLGSKTVAGYANSFYYDPQMTATPNAAYNPANAMGVLKLYVTPIDATRTVYLEVHRPIQDIVNPGDTFDLPLECYEALTKGLAAAVGDKYEIPEQRLMRVKQEAAQALEEIANWGAQEQAPMWFQPDYRMGMGR
jgi:hypothetical protein